MASTSTEFCIQQTRQRLDSNALEARTDEELLESFINGSADEAEISFRSLVLRHGPMVLGVCRQILGTDHDAEDSFQAVFLVLARRAGTIRDRRLVASWLYEVAYRISVKSRVDGARRRTRERQVVAMSADSFDPREEYDRNDAWNELRSVLQSEVDRLPEKYRIPVILCYLEGKSNTEAAKILDWPVGSVKGRLARAREILHSRLMRRNLVLSATFLLSALHRETVFAEVVPSRLVDSTVKAGMSVAGKATASQSPASSEAMILMEAYLQPRRSRRLLAGLAAVIILGGIAGISQGAFFQSERGSFQGRFGNIIETISSYTPLPISGHSGSTCKSSASH